MSSAARNVARWRLVGERVLTDEELAERAVGQLAAGLAVDAGGRAAVLHEAPLGQHLAEGVEGGDVVAALVEADPEGHVEHAKSRRQFDQPIGAFQAVQHKCADLFVQVEKARSTAWFAMMAVAEDDPRRTLAASMAKAAASDCQALVCTDAIQIHGGMGYTWESDVQLFVKRAKTLEALFGTGRAHRRRIAELLEV